MSLLSPVLAKSGWIYCHGAFSGEDQPMLVTPLYYPSETGDRYFQGELYGKYISVGAKPDQINPSLLGIPTVSRTTYALPREDIRKVFEPTQAYEQLLASQDVRRSAIAHIVDAASVPKTQLGIIGSRACECVKPDSDIDIIVKGSQYVASVLRELHAIIRTGDAKLMSQEKAAKYAHRYSEFYGLDGKHIYNLFATDPTKLYIEGQKISFIFVFDDQEKDRIPHELNVGLAAPNIMVSGTIINTSDAWLYPRHYSIMDHTGKRFDIWSHEWLFKNFFPVGTEIEVTAQKCSDSVLALTTKNHKILAR